MVFQLGKKAVMGLLREAGLSSREEADAMYKEADENGEVSLLVYSIFSILGYSIFNILVGFVNGKKKGFKDAK